jgi:hypothetical protein
VAILMHASFTGWLLVLFPATSLAQSLFWQAGFAVALWSVVAAVLLSNARRRDEGKRHALGAAHGQAPRGVQIV